MQLLLTLLINLVPAASVVVFGWSAFTLLLLYWLENLIVGVVNVAKIALAAASTGKEAMKLSFFLIPFFVFHYGLFCAVHGMLLWTLFGDRAAADTDLVGLPFAVAARLRADPFLAYNAALLAAYHVLAFLIFWVGQGRWRSAEPFSQMFEPYPRIIVVHLTIMLAGVPVTLLGQPVIAVVILALIKTGLEVGVLSVGGGFQAAQVKLAEKARESFKQRMER